MDIKDLQINILTQTIGDLHGQLAEARSALIVMQSQKNKEVPNGEHKDSPADGKDSIS